MYYNNIYFHNVNLMKKDEYGNYLLSRFKEDVLIEIISKTNITNEAQSSDPNYFNGEGALGSMAYNFCEPQYKSKALKPYMAFKDLSLGTELRFKLVSDEVKIRLRLMPGQSPALCEVFFGNFFAGKEYCLTVTDYNVLEYTFKKTAIPKPLKITSRKKDVGFASDVVRILLPTRSVLFAGVTGQTEIPQVYEMPHKNVVFLGSNTLGANDVDRPSLSIAFEVASRLNANCYNLSTNLPPRLTRKLKPLILATGKRSVLISDLLYDEINDKNCNFQLYSIKYKIKFLSKFKKRAFFIDYIFNCFNFKNKRRELKARAKIEKLLRKKNSISPYQEYANCMLFGNKELPAFAVGKITVDLVNSINENYAKFNLPKKVSTKYVYYSIKTADDEPTNKPKVMGSREKRRHIRAVKKALRESKRRK